MLVLSQFKVDGWKEVPPEAGYPIGTYLGAPVLRVALKLPSA